MSEGRVIRRQFRCKHPNKNAVILTNQPDVCDYHRAKGWTMQVDQHTEYGISLTGSDAVAIFPIGMSPVQGNDAVLGDHASILFIYTDTSKDPVSCLPRNSYYGTAENVSTTSSGWPVINDPLLIDIIINQHALPRVPDREKGKARSPKIPTNPFLKAGIRDKRRFNILMKQLDSLMSAWEEADLDVFLIIPGELKEWQHAHLKFTLGVRERPETFKDIVHAGNYGRDQVLTHFRRLYEFASEGTQDVYATFNRPATGPVIEIKTGVAKNHDVYAPIKVNDFNRTIKRLYPNGDLGRLLME